MQIHAMDRAKMLSKSYYVLRSSLLREEERRRRRRRRRKTSSAATPRWGVEPELAVGLGDRSCHA